MRLGRAEPGEFVGATPTATTVGSAILAVAAFVCWAWAWQREAPHLRCWLTDFRIWRSGTQIRFWATFILRKNRF